MVQSNKQIKVVVSHAEKQHVNELLIALDKKQWLSKFYTLFATNKFTYFLNIPFFKNNLKKRFFKNLISSQIISYPLIGIFSRFLKSEYLKVKYAYNIFDYFVSLNLKQNTVDIVIGYESANVLFFKRSKKLKKITILDLASVHDNMQVPFLLEAGIDRNLNDYIYKNKQIAYSSTDYIFALSTLAKSSLVNNGVTESRIFLTYLGVNHSIFLPKKTYNLFSTISIYFVGTVCKRKGINFLLKLFDILHSQIDIKLTIVGPIDDFQEKFDMREGITYLPFMHHEELLKIHHNNDLFVFPSLIDSWAQVVIEAMACGTPVLVSENTGAKDAVTNECGMILPINNMEKWSNTIKYFYYNREQIELYGRKAHQESLKYTWENYHNQVVSAIEDIAIKEGLN